MTTKQLMQIVEQRGLKIVVKDGRPEIVCTDRKVVTDRLLAVLKRHRERIIDMLGHKPQVGQT